MLKWQSHTGSEAPRRLREIFGGYILPFVLSPLGTEPGELGEQDVGSKIPTYAETQSISEAGPFPFPWCLGKKGPFGAWMATFGAMDRYQSQGAYYGVS